MRSINFIMFYHLFKEGAQIQNSIDNCLCLCGFQDSCSHPPSPNCLKPEEITVELRKMAGSLGMSVSVSLSSSF